MIGNDTGKPLAVGICFVLIVALSAAYKNPETRDLQALVAPIAFYPDALVAQILAASAFPDEVAIAGYWLRQNPGLTGTSLVQAVDKQQWNASVKALTGFPSVLDNLANHLTWTSSLGEAYRNQPSEVMSGIQKLRAKGQPKSAPGD